VIIAHVLPFDEWKIKHRGTGFVLLKFGVLFDCYESGRITTHDLEIGMETEVWIGIYLEIYRLEMEGCVVKIFDLKGNMIKYIKPKHI